jgi:hypothetical protein
MMQKTVLWYVVLYEFEAWSLTLLGEQRLRVSENWVLRKFGHKRGSKRRNQITEY